jgi:hypothetical protein
MAIMRVHGAILLLFSSGSTTMATSKSTEELGSRNEGGSSFRRLNSLNLFQMLGLDDLNNKQFPEETSEDNIPGAPIEESEDMSGFPDEDSEDEVSPSAPPSKEDMDSPSFAPIINIWPTVDTGSPQTPSQTTAPSIPRPPESTLAPSQPSQVTPRSCPPVTSCKGVTGFDGNRMCVDLQVVGMERSLDICSPKPWVEPILANTTSICGRCDEQSVPTAAPTTLGNICDPLEYCGGDRVVVCIDILGLSSTACVSEEKIPFLIASKAGFCGRCPTAPTTMPTIASILPTVGQGGPTTFSPGAPTRTPSTEGRPTTPSPVTEGAPSSRPIVDPSGPTTLSPVTEGAPTSMPSTEGQPTTTPSPVIEGAPTSMPIVDPSGPTTPSPVTEGAPTSMPSTEEEGLEGAPTRMPSTEGQPTSPSPVAVVAPTSMPSIDAGGPTTSPVTEGAPTIIPSIITTATPTEDPLEGCSPVIPCELRFTKREGILVCIEIRNTQYDVCIPS